ncbi:Gfo/Idh/MocA family protein [Homoserinibacter sp. GY 40078]|uniref:Gfo/Idh/MocA family protein n=1 Tax=Homoserinibacter sp. GY 40078 TaxID=2603275 RepID=UPI0011CCBD9F|nr:Gfo/Idh/MocA family oxidoreductase [Homoserinibacter sp. GY 40078]TXK19740.1 Gfo/Idh/MocA family oxidoreductase [Homoserinibacter sp. GY 40078]
MIDVLVVGAGFGRDFLPLYQLHPEVARVGLVEPDAARRRATADAFGLDADYEDLDSALASGTWDAVHLLSPVRFHVEQTLAVLDSGRACASAVPMATELDDIARVVEAASGASGAYMMMETALYQREFLHALHLRDTGALGRLGYLSGAHIQDLDGYAPYWMGYPPMRYATHVIAPLLALADARVESVTCLGSGELLPLHRGDGTNPYPIESALMRLSTEAPLTAQVTVSFFENARSYQEGFNVYGDRGALEWPSVEGDAAIVYSAGPADGARGGRGIRREEVHAPDRTDSLPAALAPFTRDGRYRPPGGRPEVTVHASHGGSHPHLVHEFVSAVVDGREPAIGARRAATITAPGIVAHESAMQGGRMLEVPAY